eukprot:16443590-Heterocapsa_arctica.AAC.1
MRSSTPSWCTAAAGPSGRVAPDSAPASLPRGEYFAPPSLSTCGGRWRNELRTTFRTPATVT